MVLVSIGAVVEMGVLSTLKRWSLLTTTPTQIKLQNRFCFCGLIGQIIAADWHCCAQVCVATELAPEAKYMFSFSKTPQMAMLFA
jgi:hypothetical protein